MAVVARFVGACAFVVVCVCVCECVGVGAGVRPGAFFLLGVAGVGILV